MRVTILSQWYPPEPVPIAHTLASELRKRGHDVRSITGFPNRPYGKIYRGYRQRWRQWQELDGVPVLRLPLYPYHGKSAVRRAANYASFATSAGLLGPALCGKTDVMYVFHPPLTVGLPAWWISLLRRVPFVYDIKDMWPETLLATGMMRSRAVLSCLHRMASFIYKRGAAIAVPSPGFRRNLISKGVAEEKIHYIPNWASEEFYYPLSPDPTMADKHGLAGHFNVVFAGNMGLAQRLESVLESVVLLRELPRVQLVFIGDGPEEPRLRQLVAERQLRNVRFLGRQPEAQMARFLALADVLLVHLRDDPLFEITIPSKTLCYMACGKPIVMAVKGDAADVVRDAGAGLICEPDNPQAIASTIAELHDMPACQREALGKAGRKAFEATYSLHTLASRYEELLCQVASSAKTGGRFTSTREQGIPR